MSVKRYHLISAQIALILALVNTLLLTILNSPSYLKSELGKPKNPLILLLVPTLGLIFVLILTISWIKRHYYRNFETKSDFKKYGTIRGFLLPITILLGWSVAAHSASIFYVLNNISVPGIWAITIEWSKFYLYLLPIVVFSPLLVIFIVIGALIEKRIYHKKWSKKND
ncbi:MAG: hypothetical protein P9X27_00555 [Candidatus Kaelpia aquatica]|nr:hypothetical protein [Candidatus Kaelpia aquatica]